MKKALHTYKVEFQVYGKYVNQDVHIAAYSPRQAKKFFYDCWKKHHRTKYAVVILVSELEPKEAEFLLKMTTNESIEERFKRQQEYIYKREEDKR